MKREPDSPDILFEDDSILALNKPDGLLISPDRWDKDLPNLMRYVHEYISPNYFNAHRLDKDTSGVVVCAKNKKILDILTGYFENRQVEKHYLALTQGVPREETFTVNRPITNDDRFPGRMKLTDHGKPCETQFQTLEKWRGYALVRATPLTGRTHQIRLHLASVKCPIIADRFYGYGKGLMLSEIKKDYKEGKHRERPLIGRLALHAESLTFNHPVTGQPLTITAPMPHDFEMAVKYLRRFA
jgi:23S rRNA pseudouridine1911/1915/1917 synthase